MQISGISLIFHAYIFGQNVLPTNVDSSYAYDKIKLEVEGARAPVPHSWRRQCCQLNHSINSVLKHTICKY